MLAFRGRRRLGLAPLGMALAAFLAFGAAGCSSTATSEPDSDYAEVKPLIYDYGLVFDCVAEAIADEGFQVERADREAGVLETKGVAGAEDLINHTQKGSRVRARVLRTGSKNFIVRLAASKLERDVTTTTTGEWRYVGRDAELLEKLKKRFDQEVEKRYKPSNSKG